jgi:hypothetical protein
MDPWMDPRFESFTHGFTVGFTKVMRLQVFRAAGLPVRRGVTSGATWARQRRRLEAAGTWPTSRTCRRLAACGLSQSRSGSSLPSLRPCVPRFSPTSLSSVPHLGFQDLCPGWNSPRRPGISVRRPAKLSKMSPPERKKAMENAQLKAAKDGVSKVEESIGKRKSRNQ